MAVEEKTGKGGLIRLSRSVVGAEEKENLARVIEDGYLGMGPAVQRFEEELKKFLDSPDVICVNSGTAALHLALLGAGLGRGDEALVQSLTFVASFQAITATGAKPVPCEIEPETCTIDLADAERKLTDKTKAIMPVHYAGGVGDLEAVYRFAKKHGLRVVEDAAHAFGGKYKGKKIGSFGDVVCFSFDGIKNITSGEGGAIITSDEKVAGIARDARLLGVHKDTEKRYGGQRSWEFGVSHQGYRYHMSSLFAAVGLAQLEKYESFAKCRKRLARRYDEGFSTLDGVETLPLDYDDVTPHIYPIKVKNEKRDRLREHLLSKNIECGVHYYPNHRLEYFSPGDAEFPVTDAVYGELLSIPLHPLVTDEDQEFVISEIRDFFGS